MPAVKQYANSHYPTGALPFTVKLIEDNILQTPVYREDVITPMVISSRRQMAYLMKEATEIVSFQCRHFSCNGLPQAQNIFRIRL